MYFNTSLEMRLKRQISSHFLLNMRKLGNLTKNQKIHELRSKYGQKYGQNGLFEVVLLLFL